MKGLNGRSKLLSFRKKGATEFLVGIVEGGADDITMGVCWHSVVACIIDIACSFKEFLLLCCTFRKALLVFKHQRACEKSIEFQF